MSDIPDSPCPRCDGTGKYQNFPWAPSRDCAVCQGSGICPVSPDPTGPDTEIVTADDLIRVAVEAEVQRAEEE